MVLDESRGDLPYLPTGNVSGRSVGIDPFHRV